jgi:NADP-dependent 3-hydroxy acid dehydrogenase YdfG
MQVKEEVKAFGEWCLGFGVPDILINNAGQFLPGSIQEEEDGILEKMIEEEQMKIIVLPFKPVLYAKQNKYETIIQSSGFALYYAVWCKWLFPIRLLKCCLHYNR